MVILAKKRVALKRGKTNQRPINLEELHNIKMKPLFCWNLVLLVGLLVYFFNKKDTNLDEIKVIFVVSLQNNNIQYMFVHV